jgi:phytanoyl-CoA hydroxylase
MILSQQQLDEFHLRGYVNGGRVLDDAAVDLLRDELQKVMEGRSANQPLLNRNLLGGSSEYGEQANAAKQVVVQIVNMFEASEAYLEHCKNPLITEAVARLCNNTDTLRVWHDQIQYTPARIGGPTGWHQDFPAWPILQPADLISAWVALDDAEIDNGCMWMVPGSHRWGKVGLQSGENFAPKYDPEQLPEGVEAKAEPLIVKKGCVAFHHCMTWHGSPPNQSDRPRRAIAVHYMPGYTIYVKGRGHPCEKHVTVQSGEVLQGDKFPVVYEKGKVLQPA